MVTKLNEVPPPSPQLTAIEYLLRVMNDPTVATELRIEAAVALLPYCHEAYSPHCLCGSR